VRFPATWVTRHPLTTYFVLSYAMSWIIAVPLALQAQGITHTHLPFTLHYLMAFGLSQTIASPAAMKTRYAPMRRTGVSRWRKLARAARSRRETSLCDHEAYGNRRHAGHRSCVSIWLREHDVQLPSSQVQGAPTE
jgi:hypothetical protein